MNADIFAMVLQMKKSACHVFILTVYHRIQILLTVTMKTRIVLFAVVIGLVRSHVCCLTALISFTMTA